MADDIFVIQALPTGPDGYPYDEIADIAICKVDLKSGTYQTVYHNIISYDPKQLGKKKLDYLAAVGKIYAEDLYAGDPEKKVTGEVSQMIEGNNVAAYDGKHEFGRYMTYGNWGLTHRTSIMPSVSAKMPISLKCRFPSDEPITIRKAYRRLLRNDPACIGTGRRAIHLAQMTSELMIHMRGKGKY
ncbi:hypothetical protein Mpt1_c06760 [Candidatus Methanoplasma termitum]|uniref:Uncharacterized protein n=1 Tax=Candidatus Methanoplasma termitum TaxID=1577791 RepID=A0A0A7LGE5_9ARCH|nr:hypothetical protein [Candidatus Methanoplasma termitum]AIZ56561.1 hypothetical protein Mpt1_c06760 [Candidatus Methanoplasma termitum]MCL2333808.1 hypothetical protein [Candidatus Methanoplasma sp.]